MAGAEGEVVLETLFDGGLKFPLGAGDAIEDEVTETADVTSFSEADRSSVMKEM